MKGVSPMSDTGIVYVVDDDPSICELIAAILEPAGLTVKTFTSAAAFAGINITTDANGRPCCLILDLEMPDLTGLELLAQRFNGKPPCPVIIVTGRRLRRTAVESMKLGAVDLLEKPFVPEAPPPSSSTPSKSIKAGHRPERCAARPSAPASNCSARASPNCSTPSSRESPPK